MIQKQPESMVVLVMFQLKPEAAVFGRKQDAPPLEGDNTTTYQYL